jgi:hypothetical protein
VGRVAHDVTDGQGMVAFRLRPGSKVLFAPHPRGSFLLFQSEP